MLPHCSRAAARVQWSLIPQARTQIIQRALGTPARAPQAAVGLGSPLLLLIPPHLAVAAEEGGHLLVVSQQVSVPAAASQQGGHQHQDQ